MPSDRRVGESDPESLQSELDTRIETAEAVSGEGFIFFMAFHAAHHQ